jgi:hypothetical protein
MTTQRCLAALVATFLLAGCSDVTTIPEPPTVQALNGRSAALLSSFNLPVQFPTGLAWDGGSLLYLSTGSGFRETHKINRILQADVGTIPTGGNPRDVTFDGTDLLFSDLGSKVDQRTVAGVLVNSFGLPFRGGGIATDGDTIWVGDVDANQLYVTANFGVNFAVWPSAVRIEGMAFDASSHTLWALTPFPGDNKIYELSTIGALIRECDSAYEGGAFGLGGIALVGPDTFYVSEPQGGNPFAGTTILIFLKSDLVCTPALVQNVSIEITPDHINPNSNGQLKVVILTDNSFNAATVDASSVHFGHNGTEASPTQSSIQDFDNDGDLDMVLRFKTQDTGVQCGDQSLVLTGKTMGGQAIQGSDAITTVGCKP